MWRSLVSRLNGVQEASSSNLDTRTKKTRTAFAVLVFFFSGGRDSNHLNASVRWTLARCGLDRIGSIVFRISTLGPRVSESRHSDQKVRIPIYGPRDREIPSGKPCFVGLFHQNCIKLNRNFVQLSTGFCFTTPLRYVKILTIFSDFLRFIITFFVIYF